MHRSSSPFESVSPSAIRSIKQRDLLNTWLRLRGRSDLLPPIAGFRPARFEDELKDIVYYVVKREASGWQFIIDSHGSRLSQAYGQVGTSNVGRDLRDYVGPQMVDLVLPIYDACAARALPVYSVSVVDDMNGCAVAYERLLLPFSTGGDITHIIASLKTISEDGKFEINNLLRNRDKPPVYKLRAVIDRELVLAQPEPLRRNVSCDLQEALPRDVVEL